MVEILPKLLLPSVQSECLCVLGLSLVFVSKFACFCALCVASDAAQAVLTLCPTATFMDQTKKAKK